MKEPKRLFESGSSLERTILGFGRDEAPSPDVAKKTLAAIAAAPMASAAQRPTTSRWARTAAIAGVAAIGIGALVAVIVADRSEPRSAALRDATSSGALAEAEPNQREEPPGANPPGAQTGVAALQSSPEPAPAAQPEPRSESVVTPDSLPNAPAPAASNAFASPAPAVPAAPAAKVELGSASIAREVELLDAVKAKLAGDPSSAARSLDTYDSEFPEGALRPEATVLRIRTLLLRGERAKAEKLGREFLAAHPTGVHAKRVRTLLGEENEGEK